MMALKKGKIDNLIELACSPQTDLQRYDDIKHLIIAFVASEQTKEVRIVIDYVKKILNSKKGDSLQKLKALNLLEAAISRGKN